MSYPKPSFSNEMDIYALYFFFKKMRHKLHKHHAFETPTADLRFTLQTINYRQGQRSNKSSPMFRIASYHRSLDSTNLSMKWKRHYSVPQRYRTVETEPCGTNIKSRKLLEHLHRFISVLFPSFVKSIDIALTNYYQQSIKFNSFNDRLSFSPEYRILKTLKLRSRV